MDHKTSIGKENIIIFTRQLALVIDSDISTYQGLEIIREKSDDESLKNVIEKLQNEIAQGASLSDAINSTGDYFPKVVCAMIEIGEESGELSNVLNQIAQNYERELDTAAKIRSAITYPAILTLLMLGVIFVLILKVLPMFNEILADLGGEMPPMTRFVMNLSQAMSHNALPIVAVIFAVVAIPFFYFKASANKAKFDKFMFSLPIVANLVSAATAVKFARNLSLLIKSDISINRGMHLIATIFDNQFVKQRISDAAEAIDRNTPIEIAIEQLNLFPWVLIKLFSVATETGHMDTMLDRAAVTMEKELDYRLERLTTVIEPLLIIILSIIVGVILISVILPIIDIMNAIG
ncbi:MAG: hypothetical protein CSB19_01935 [Clostridiales bacterium]|nr:MAG: hypothetical protein CSB19_01935 [Clostridiales bacterium]